MAKINNKRTIKDYVKLYFSGILMGSSDIVPGVSGGTMAFILGIYEELITAISSINKDLIAKILKLRIKKILSTFPWKFLSVLGLGIVTAVLSLSHGLEYMLENQPVYIWSFFTGLILASVPTITKRVKKWELKKYFVFVFGVIFAYVLVGLTPGESPNTPLSLLLSGALASSAMILPGISGSFILVLLGKYETVLSAVNERDIYTVALIGIGAVLGLILFSKFLNYFFNKYHDITVVLMAGFVLGAVRKIWPFKREIFVGEQCYPSQTLTTDCNRVTELISSPPNFSTPEHLLGILLILLGAVVVYLINRMSVDNH